jgi:hypothetical protein
LTIRDDRGVVTAVSSRKIMRFLSRLFALCLALFWVPVTAHCRIEALGIDFAACSDDCHENAPIAETHDDGCAIVESGFYKCGSSTITVPAPSVTTRCAFLFCECVPDPEPVTGPGVARETATRPRNWVPTWHFVQRAALSPRAPSLDLA